MLIPIGFLGAGGAGANAMELIATVNATGGDFGAGFSSIPQTYKHLQIRVTDRSSYAQATDNIFMTVNGASNYSSHWLTGSGGSVSAFSDVNRSNGAWIATIPGSANTTNSFGALIIDILDYASTNKYKTIRVFSGFTTSTYVVRLSSGLTQSTAAITDIGLNHGFEYALSGSRFSLYGVK